MSKIDIPTYDAMMNPLLEAIKQLGGSGTIEEINSKVAEIMGLGFNSLVQHGAQRIPQKVC